MDNELPMCNICEEMSLDLTKMSLVCLYSADM